MYTYKLYNKLKIFAQMITFYTHNPKARRVLQCDSMIPNSLAFLGIVSLWLFLGEEWKNWVSSNLWWFWRNDV